jgi:hypothetical protein
MNSIIPQIAALDLKSISDEALHIFLHSFQAESIRRNQFVSSSKSLLKQVRNRIIGKSLCGRTQEDLFLPEWDDVYKSDAGSQEKKFYVYAHVRPHPGFMEIKTSPDQFAGLRIPGVPFYIGKGAGGRAYDLSRNDGHGAELRSLKKSGVSQDEIVFIIKDGLTESEALKLESKLIYILGTKYESTTNGLLVNLDLPKRPDALDLVRHGFQKTELIHKKRIK